MIHIVVFAIVQLAVSAYGGWRGGAPERIVALCLILAAVANATLPTDRVHSFHRVEWGAVCIDVVLLVALVSIATHANRYWPMWIAALQLDAIAIHAVRAYDPAIWALAYARISGLIAYPILAVLLIGTIRHRQRTARSGPEAPWNGRSHDVHVHPSRR